jgi:hypothetical protein
MLFNISQYTVFWAWEKELQITARKVYTWEIEHNEHFDVLVQATE